MAEAPPLPPEWLEAAHAAATDLGLGTDLSGMPADAWRRVWQATGQTMARGLAGLPPGWEAALARQAGRPDADELARDEADAKLAEEGEVFGTEDDA